MRKRLRTLLNRRFVLLFLFFISFQIHVLAQADIVIGTGTAGNTTTGYPCPLQDYFEGSRAQYLFRASELTAAGMGPGTISALKFNVSSLGTAGVIEGYSIKMKGTTVATLSSSSWETGTSTVYGPVNYQPVDGVNTLTLSTPFSWNGTDNILIEICNESPNASSGSTSTRNPVVAWTTGLTFNGSHTYRVDGVNSVCGTSTTTNTGTQTTRPNITFFWTTNVGCSGTPTAGTAASSVASICAGETFKLSLTGFGTGSGLTVQWQSSLDNSTWSNISGATQPNHTLSQSQSMYYRAVVTCTNSGLSSSTTSVQVLSPALVSGTFTINKAQPTGSGNFQSFGDAYNFLKCGINGAVTFNVAAGSGPYEEQLIMLPVPGTSATNTITFNGNGATIQATPVDADRHIVRLDGADYITINNLKILAKAGSSYGWGIHLTNGADHNTITNCDIDISAVTSATQSNSAGIVASGTTASVTADGSASYNTISNNTITGAYQGIIINGATGSLNAVNNTITRNTIKDFYANGIELTENDGAMVSFNNISRGGAEQAWERLLVLNWERVTKKVW